ncbi:MAG: CvpA family protein [Defluviitaleaceae bacterium]|nr:CvpA family protein [Defluviitaleaceae bacterium]
MTIYNIIDIIILGVLAGFAFQGLKRGMVMSIAGGLTLVVAIIGANIAADNFAPQLESLIRPLFSDMSDLNIDAHIPAFPWAQSGALVETTARFFTFIFAFLGITLALYYASRLLDTVVKLPILNMFNRLGGLFGGVIFGGAVVWLGVYVVRYFGFLGPGIVGNTRLLSFVFSMMP